MLRNDCAKETPFYNSYLDPFKPVHWSGLIKSCLKRAGWLFSSNSIGQTVPVDWRKKAEARRTHLEGNVGEKRRYPSYR